MRHQKFISSMIFFLAILSSFAAAATTLSIDPVTSESAFSESFVVSVAIDTNESIYGAQFDVLYDPTMFAASTVEDGGFLSQDGDSLFEAVKTINHTAGKVSYAVTRFTFLTGVTGQGAVANITFTPLVNNNESAITIENIVIGDPSASSVAVDSIENGTLRAKTIHSIVINEIMKDPSSVADTAGEYVELYNPNSFSVDINGWTLKDNGAESHLIDNGGALTIENGSYLVLCADDSAANGGFTCDYEYSGFTLDNTVDEVVLQNEGGHEVDIVEYDGSFPSTTGVSMELAQTTLDNNNDVNWRDATIPFGLGDKGTPGSENVVLNGPDITNVVSVSSHEDQDAIVLATITDYVPITNVTLLSDHEGVITEYDVVDKTGDVYSFTIDNSHLENQQMVNFAFRAEDSEGFVAATAFEFFTITNRAPEQTGVIPTQILWEDDTHFLDISGFFNDPDGDNVTYTVIESDNITSGVNVDGLAFFQPDPDFNGVQTVTFTVTDEYGAEVNSSNVTLDVGAQNDAPFFTDVPTGLNTSEEGIIAFNVGAEDIDGDTLTFSVNDTDFSVSGSTITYVPATDFTGVKTVQVSVFDGTVTVSTDINITVFGENDAPEISSIPSQSVTEDVPFVLDVTTYLSDPDNDVSELSISEDSIYATVSGKEITFNYPNGVAQDIVTVTVSDGLLTDETNVTVNVANVNDAPVMGFVADQTVAEDDTVSIQLSAVDDDPTNDTLTYSTNAGFGSLNSVSGLFEWTPGTADIGTHTAEFRVADGNGGEDAQNVTFTVTSVLQITDVDITVDGNVSNTVADGVTVVAKPGSTIVVAVTYQNLAAEQLFGIASNVTLETNPAPQDVEDVGNLNAGASSTVSYTVQVPTIITEGVYDLDMYAKGVTSGLVPRHATFQAFVEVKKADHEVILDTASFSPNNLQCVRDGQLDLTLTNIGDFDEDVEVMVTNAALGISVSENVSITKNTQSTVSIPISAPNTPKGSYVIDVDATYFFGSESTSTSASVDIANCAPVLNTIAAQSGIEESELTFSVSGSDFDFGDSLTFSASEPNMHFTNVNGSDATGSWIPQNADVGVQSIEVFVTDGDDTVGQNVTFTITNINDAPVIDSSSPSSNPIIAEDNGESQSFSVTASDEDGDALSYAWYLDGSLQSTATGYTYVADGTVGTFNVSAVVSDAEFSVQREWTLTATDVPLSNNYVLTYEGSPSAAQNVTFSNEHGKIDFSGETIDFGTLVDLDSVVLIEHGAAGIDSSAAPQLDKAAQIMLFNLPFDETPVLFKNSGFGVAGDTSCGSDCENVGYNTSTNMLTFDVDGFSTYFTLVNNSKPVISSSPGTTAIINELYSYQVVASDADGDTLTYSVTTSNPAISFNSASNVVSWVPDNYTTESITVEVTDGKGGKATQSFSVKVQDPIRLAITDLDVKVDGESDKNLEDGDKISEEALPGSQVEFTIELENLFDEDTLDLEIEDIEVEVTIIDIDDGDDLDSDVDEFDLKAEEDETVKIDFRVPLEVDEDVYDVIVEARGTDEDGTDHEVVVNLELEVEKESHDIRFIEASAVPSLVQCDRSISFRTEIINVGEDDEEDVDLEVVSPDLGIHEVVRGIELESGTDDNRYSKTFNERISSDVRNGVYIVDVNTYYDGRLAQSRTLDITVGSCTESSSVRETVRSSSSSSSEAEDVTVVIPDLETRDPVVVSGVGSSSGTDSVWDLHTLLVVILLIIFVGLTIFIIGAGIILLK